MLSFRRKILLSDLTIFLVLLILAFPFVERTVKIATLRTLQDQAKDQIKLLEKASTLDEVISRLNKPQFAFVMVSIEDAGGNMLWESHPEREKLEFEGYYTEHYSDYFHQSFGYIDQPLMIQGKEYLFRTGFPLQEIHDLTFRFEVGFLLFGALLLLLYSTTTQLILHRVTQPFQQITRAIVKYTEGREEFLPRIVLQQPDQGREFDKLAFTLNSLSDRIQKEIDLLTQQRKETEGILESLGEGVIAFNPAGKITFANRAACEMLGTTHDSIVDHVFKEIPSRHTDLLKKGDELMVEVFQTSEPAIQTWKGKVYLDLIAAPLAQKNGAILVLQDKTSDYKVLEMGKDFIANASHELRTPITIIRGFAETLQDLPKLSPEVVRDITGTIVRTCGRLEKLVKSLLTISDIENVSKTHFITIDLRAIVEQCKAVLHMVHPDTKITIRSDLPHAFICGDPDLLEMAISNLLDNAVKYSQAPAQIEVRLRSQKGEIHLDIQDHGIGIPEADVPHIFDRFYTVDKARSRKSGGAGLGLSIVKTIIEKHSGRVAVVSKPGQGSIFIMTMNSAK